MFPWLRQRAPKPEKWCNTKELIAKRIVTYMLKGCIKNYSVVIYNKVLLMIHNYRSGCIKCPGSYKLLEFF